MTATHLEKSGIVITRQMAVPRADEYPLTAWIVAAILLVGMTLAVYLQVTSFDFVNYDDNAYITSNRHIAGALAAVLDNMGKRSEALIELELAMKLEPGNPKFEAAYRSFTGGSR